MKIFLVFITVAILAPNIASAKRVGGIFGKSERIEEIGEFDLKGPNGEELYLAYKTTSLFFFMGVYISDDGYVLGIKKSYGSYYPLSEEKIKEFQAGGHLPNPLPKYKIPLSERLWGFSLWMLLTVVAIIYFFPKGKEANFIAGCNHYFGKEVPLDYKKAFKYFMKSASKGHAAAQYNLGIMYLNGQGTAINTEKATSYFEEAVNQGYANAEFALGGMYFDGNGMLKDVNKALLFYENACSKGHKEACRMVNYIKENNLNNS